MKLQYDQQPVASREIVYHNLLLPSKGLKALIPWISGAAITNGRGNQNCVLRVRNDETQCTILLSAVVVGQLILATQTREHWVPDSGGPADGSFQTVSN